MRVLYAVLGAPLTLAQNKIKRFNGGLEAYNYLWVLSRNPSIDELLIYSIDWKKLSNSEREYLDPRGIIRCIEYKDMPTVDFGIIKGAYGWGRVNNIGTIWKDEKHTYTPLGMQQTYAGKLLNYLNDKKPPYVLLVADPRTIAISNGYLQRYDTIHKPLEVMSQINGELLFRSIREYSNSYVEQEFITQSIPLRYRRIEALNAIFWKDQPIVNKDINMTIIAMQDVNPGVKDSRRFNMIKEWILNNFTDVNIYGKWDDYYTKGYSQFRGLLHYKDLDEVMARTKYTFIIGIGSDWSTGKWAECLTSDVIPFVAPDYDTQYNAIPEDSYIRVKTKSELLYKINELNKEDSKRLNLLNDLKAQLLKDVYNGVFLYKELNKALSPIGLSISESQISQTPKIPKSISLF